MIDNFDYSQYTNSQLNQNAKI